MNVMSAGLEKALGDFNRGIVIPRSVADAKLVMRRFHKRAKEYGAYALDTETTGLSWQNDRMVMISLYTPGMAVVLPLAWASHNIHAGNAAEILKNLAEDFELRVYMHNAKFDMHFLYNNGVWLDNEVHDTLVAGFDLSVEKPVKLKLRAREELGIEMTEFKDKFKLGGKSKLTLMDYPVKDVADYAALDVFSTYWLADKYFEETGIAKYHHSVYLRNEDPDLSLLYDRVDAKVVPVLWDMERAGVRIDVPKLEKHKITYEQSLVDLEKRMLAEAGVAFNMRSPKQVTQVFSRRGIALKSTDEKHMGVVAKRGDALAKLMMEHRKSSKILSTYIIPMLAHKDPQNRVHTSLNLHVAATGRLCVARGTAVDAVRDVSKHPKGVPVECIKADDLVYTYDDDCKLTIKPVKWAGKTGVKPVVRLTYWDGNYSEQLSLDLTADHPVRLVTGEYKEAGKLKAGDRVLALSRYICEGYARLNITGTHWQPKEHRFIARVLGLVTGDDHRVEQIHHRDGNKRNNRPENLQVMTVAQHAKMHWDEMDSDKKRVLAEAASVRTARLIREGRIPKFHRYGADNHNYRQVSRWELLRDLARAKGKTTRTTMDDNFVAKKCREAGFESTSVRLRYDRDGKLIPRRVLHRVATSEVILNRMSVRLNLSAYATRNILRRYGYAVPEATNNNHKILSVEELPEPVEVYDIEVEDTHNFIANEICVHNSSSAPLNLQNQSKDQWWREMFIAAPGCKLVVRDYSQIELRILAVVANDEVMLGEYEAGADVHMNNGHMIASVLGVDWDGLTAKEQQNYRTWSKSTLGFGEHIC